MSNPPVNALVTIFDDLELAKRAIRSVPDDVPVYVVDGRYETFPGDYDLTPGAAEWCADQPTVTYCAPPAERLPWGSDRDDWHPHTRYDQYAEAIWKNYEVLPGDEWVIKLDADEELVQFDRSVFTDLDPALKYTPAVFTPAGMQMFPDRVYVPAHWTFWVDDVQFPRSLFPRSTPVEQLATVQSRTSMKKANQGGIIDDIQLLNYGRTRDAAYRERRLDQLERIGRPNAATEYADRLADE